MIQKLKLFFLLFIFSCAYANAKVEYDIFILAPEGQELTSNTYPRKLSDEGYVVGHSYNFDNLEPGVEIPFLYHHASREFRSIKIPLSAAEYGFASEINRNGIVAGTFSNDGNCIWGCDDRAFIYNSHTHEFVDILFAIPEAFERNKYLSVVGLTDDNTVILRNYNNSFGAFSYNYDLQTASFNVRDTVQEVNSKGQMIGGDYSWMTESYVDGWFFDPATGYHDLGSLDQFGRWSVRPTVISENGYVAGYGSDSQNDQKGFLWSLKTGLIKIDAKERDDFYPYGINDLGEVAGDSLDVKNDAYRAFVFTKGKKTIDLGTLGGLSSQALAINNASQVVGRSSIYKKSDEERAFIWTSKQGMRDLTPLIPSNSGWKALNEASSINKKGWIVGRGIYYGRDQGFLLVPRNSKEKSFQEGEYAE